MDWAPGTAAPQRTHSAAVRRKPSNPRSTLLHVYDRGLRREHGTEQFIRNWGVDRIGPQSHRGQGLNFALLLTGYDLGPDNLLNLGEI